MVVRKRLSKKAIVKRTRESDCRESESESESDIEKVMSKRTRENEIATSNKKAKGYEAYMCI